MQGKKRAKVYVLLPQMNKRLKSNIPKEDFGKSTETSYNVTINFMFISSATGTSKEEKDHTASDMHIPEANIAHNPNGNTIWIFVIDVLTSTNSGSRCSLRTKNANFAPC